VDAVEDDPVIAYVMAPNEISMVGKKERLTLLS
jgi:hypothetical protein